MKVSFVLTVILMLFVAWFVALSIRYIVQEYFRVHDDNAPNLRMPGHPD